MKRLAVVIALILIAADLALIASGRALLANCTPLGHEPAKEARWLSCTYWTGTKFVNAATGGEPSTMSEWMPLIPDR